MGSAPGTSEAVTATKLAGPRVPGGVGRGPPQCAMLGSLDRTAAPAYGPVWTPQEDSACRAPVGMPISLGALYRGLMFYSSMWGGVLVKCRPRDSVLLVSTANLSVHSK